MQILIKCKSTIESQFVHLDFSQPVAKGLANGYSADFDPIYLRAASKMRVGKRRESLSAFPAKSAALVRLAVRVQAPAH
jgi:hypothetical protein